MVTVVENTPPSEPATTSSTGTDAAGVGIGVGKILGGIALVLAVLFAGYFLLNAQKTSARNSAVRTEAISNAASSVSNSASSVADSVGSALNPSR